MDRDLAAYEPFFGFVERPFSLTPDPRYYYRSRSHSSAFDAVTAGLGRDESVLLVSGDLGVGKTTLCRTLIDVLSQRTRAAMVGNALISPDDLLRLLLQDFGVLPKDELWRGGPLDRSSADLRMRFEAFLSSLRLSREGAVLIVDEAQNLPSATADLILALAPGGVAGVPSLQVVLAAQAPAAGAAALPQPIELRLATRARLLSIDRDECERYLAHRVTIAGGTNVTFAPRALEVIYGLSGGLPRLINLIAERALREAAASSSFRIEASMVESAASALEILRARPKRFRWFGSSDGSTRGL